MPDSARAFGKFIVLGEHSILYGGQALTYPIRQLSLEFKIRAVDSGPRFNGKALEAWQFEKLKAVMASMNINADLRTIEINSNIPIGKGLGSSAALCVAMARSFFPQTSPIAIAQLATIGEGVFHGRSSGADPYTISLEQPLVYKMENFEHGPLKLAPNTEYAFLLRDSGIEHSTSEVIKKVSDLKNSNATLFNSLIDQLKENTQRGLRIIENNLWDQLGAVLNDSNRCLFEMGLGNDSLKNAIESLIKDGALGAKLTGAGLGGYVFGLFHEHKIPAKLNSGDIIVRCCGS